MRFRNSALLWYEKGSGRGFYNLFDERMGWPGAAYFLHSHDVHERRVLRSPGNLPLKANSRQRLFVVQTPDASAESARIVPSHRTVEPRRTDRELDHRERAVRSAGRHRRNPG